MISLLHLGRIDYGTALNLQKSLVDLRKQERISNTLLLLEHNPVITLGRNTRRENLIASPALLAQKGVELYEADRGGDVTFHGPGQLVGYPIFNLRSFSPRMGAVEYVRNLEEVLIRTCGDLGIPCQRIPGLTGVWTQMQQGVTGLNAATRSKNPQRFSQNHQEMPNGLNAVTREEDPQRFSQKKIAAIGVHISRAVTSHGFALNVTTDLDYFKLIVPCGISDKPVTSIEQEIEVGKTESIETKARPIPSMEEVMNLVSTNFGRIFRQQILWLESLDQLMHTGNQSGNDEASQKPTEADTIDIPLQVPRELREIHRNPGGARGNLQPGGVEGLPEDEIFLA